jgi:hypothetical protein
MASLPETKDWEFFLLTLNQDGTTTIASRGTTEITTAQGQACASCHSMADAEWDFVCNTYGDANNGNPNCGFDLMAEATRSAHRNGSALRVAVSRC